MQLHYRPEQLKPTRLSGFTLIEILLVVMITSMLMYSMSVIFKKAALISAVSEAEAETRQKARGIFSRLKLDLSNAFVDADGNYFRYDESKEGSILEFVTTLKYNPEGFPGRLDITQVAYELVDKDVGAEIKLKKRYPAAVAADSKPLLIRYVLTYLSKEHAEKYTKDYPDQPRLEAHDKINLAEDKPMAGQYKNIIASNVTSFQVQFLDMAKVADTSLDLSKIDSYWVDTWDNDSKKLPMAVKVRVGLKDDKNTMTRMFESILHPRFTRGTE